MNKIITINRKFGSGGRQIGYKLAEGLGIPFYNSKIISEAAKETGFAVDTFKYAEDKATNSLLYSIAMGMNALSSQDAGYSGLSLDDRVFLAQSNVIRKAAEGGPCVIVDKCADYILRDREDVVNIFITASVDFRIKRSIEEDNIPQKKAAEVVLKKDRARANYYKYHSGERWDNLNNYDIVIRSDLIGIDNTIDVLIDYFNKIK